MDFSPPPGVLEHVVPVGWIIGATLIAFVSLCGVLWGFFSWLRSRISEGVEAALHGDAFEVRVTRIVQAAFTSSASHLVEAIQHLEVRQMDHGRRLGELEQGVAAIRGRMQSTRSGDLET